MDTIVTRLLAASSSRADCLIEIGTHINELHLHDERGDEKVLDFLDELERLIQAKVTPTSPCTVQMTAIAAYRSQCCSSPAPELRGGTHR